MTPTATTVPSTHAATGIPIRSTLADRGGATEATYELTVGLRVPMPGLLKRRAEKTIIDTALKGLKNRVESRPGDGEDST